MKIKSSDQNGWKDHPIRQFIKRFRIKVILITIVLSALLISVSLSSIFYGIHMNRTKKADSFKEFFDNAIKTKINIIPNYVRGQLFSHPERIVIDIKHKHFQMLAYKRQIAMDKGILLTNETDYVPASIRYNNRTIDVKLRLKGDWTDHLLGEKWSFRIKVKGDNTIFGMKQFSIHHPKTRNFIYEWLLHRALRRENVMALRYDFIDVTINGKNLGVYALEEHFEKRLIENNHFREGPILKFNENLLWADKAEHYLKGEMNPTGLYSQNASNLDVFKQNTVFQDPVLYKQFITGHNLLEAFRYRKLPTHKVFDIGKMATYFALLDLFGGSHSLIWHNLRFYYNPVTSLLEPIGFDGNAGKPTIHILGSNRSFNDVPNKFKDIVFSDDKFMQEYVKILEKVCSDSYLDDFFQEVDNEFQEKLKILYKDFPFFHFSKANFYKNRKIIRSVLNPIKGIHAYFYESNQNKILVELGNIQVMPIEVLNITYKDSLKFELSNKILLPPFDPLDPIDYQKVTFDLPSGVTWIDTMSKYLKVKYMLLGTQNIRNESVFSWPRVSASLIQNDLIRQDPNFNDFSFISVNYEKREIYFNQGDWSLNQNLVIPKGYNVICRENTRLNLVNSATILSYSPLDFRGTEESPILVVSTDSTGQGIVVINAGRISTIDFVSFYNLSNPSKDAWYLTGAVTFYESPVNILNTQFLNNRSEDALNIIRSNFTIEQSLFDKIFSDAFDGDFAKGTISNSTFLDCGNDAIDVSGSVVAVENVHINRAGDKALSAGEDSKMTSTNVDIINSEIAVASKDRSEIIINKVKISNCKVGFTLFQKKPEFDSAFIAASNLEMINISIPYLVEENSKLIVDGVSVGTNRNNVEAVLYGVEFGKSSKSFQ